MLDTKITGYILLIIGILTILLSGLSVYQVFTKRTNPIDLFNFSGISIDTSKIGQQIDTTSLPPSAQELIKTNSQTPQKTEILPAEVLNQTSNIFAHLFLMGFIASIGYKLAGLGVMLLRPVEVKVKTKEVTDSIKDQ